MRHHYFFLQIPYLIIAFLQQVINFLLCQNRVRSDICAAAAEYSDILIFDRIAVYVLNAIKFSQKISCG